MARKSKLRIKQIPQPARAPAVPWYKRAWFLISTTTVVVSAILLKGPTLLQNARILPSEFRETMQQFTAWAKEDSEWSGRWSSFPEGYVDMADMDLSDVDMQITIWANQGYIDGTIATKKVCQSIPFVNYVLLRGKVSGNTAVVTAWDIIQGHKRDFAELKLVRDGVIMTVTPISGRKEWFPDIARIALHPGEQEEDHSPDHEFCVEERKLLFDQIRPTTVDEG